MWPLPPHQTTKGKYCELLNHRQLYLYGYLLASCLPSRAHTRCVFCWSAYAALAWCSLRSLNCCFCCYRYCLLLCSLCTRGLSAPDRTPPLAIYVRFFALFRFWRWFSMRSFSFPLASSTALDIAISHPLTSWPRACSVGLGGLCVRRWR